MTSSNEPKPVPTICGLSINSTNDILNNRLDPTLIKFTQGMDAINTVIGGTDGGDVGRGFHIIANSVNNAIPVIDQMTASMKALVAAMAQGGFAARTVAQRFSA